MSCFALNSRLYDCRSYAQAGSYFCHQHASQDRSVLKERWIQKFLLGNPDMPAILFLNMSSHKQKRLLRDLSSGLITLTKEDIARIPTEASHVDTFVFLVIHGYAKPQDFPEHLLVAYRYYSTLASLKEMAPRRRIQELGRMLDYQIETHMILASGETLFLFLSSVAKIILAQPETQNYLMRYIPVILDSEAAKELCWWPRDLLNTILVGCEKTLGKDHPLTQYFLQRWLLDLKELYTTEKCIQKIKMDSCKEELMMNRWHPSRILRQLEMGLDVDDM